MKGIINANIAGIAFKLEDEAYSRLKSYLDQIEKNYSGSNDGKEILADIEARIAEVILTHQDASVTVSLPLVESILQRLGAPEDISEKGPENNQQEIADNIHSAGRIPHRLHRNPDGAKLGGVCSGLAAYFNINLVITRLIFAAPVVLFILFRFFLSSGVLPLLPGLAATSVRLYCLLWIVIPKAKTPLQKLEMRGEKVTKESLEKTFREEFKTRANTPKNIETRAKNERNASVFADIFSIIGKILLFCVKAFAAIFGFCLIFGIAAAVTAIILVPFHFIGEIRGVDLMPLQEVLLILLVLILIIPLILAIFSILKSLFGFRQGKAFSGTMVVIWLITLVFGTVIFIKEFNNINIDGKTIHEWKKGGKIFQEILQDNWENDIDMNGVLTTTRHSTLGHYKRTTTWTALKVSSDTLVVVPMASSKMSPEFVLKIRKGDAPEFPLPTLAVRKSYKAPGEEKRNQFFKKIVVNQEFRNDTLFLDARIPNLPNARAEYACGELFVPENMTVIVNERIPSSTSFSD